MFVLTKASACCQSLALGKPSMTSPLGPCGIKSERCLDGRQHGAHAHPGHSEHKLEAPFASAHAHAKRYLLYRMPTEPLPHQELLRRDTDSARA